MNLYVRPAVDPVLTQNKSAHTRSTVLDDTATPTQWNVGMSNPDMEDMKAFLNNPRLMGAPSLPDMQVGAATPTPDRQLEGLSAPSAYGSSADSYGGSWGSGLAHNTPTPTMTPSNALPFGASAPAPAVAPAAPLSGGVRPQYHVPHLSPADPMPPAAPWTSEEELYYQNMAQYMDRASQIPAEANRIVQLKDPRFFNGHDIIPDPTINHTASRAPSVSQVATDATSFGAAPTMRIATNFRSLSRSPSPRANKEARWDYRMTTRHDTPGKVTSSANAKSRPFVCSYCSRAFARKHDLERHARVHVCTPDELT